jgi:hypothetical protein
MANILRKIVEYLNSILGDPNLITKNCRNCKTIDFQLLLYLTYVWKRIVKK